MKDKPILFVFILCLSASGVHSLHAEEEKRPNVIVFLADDLGWTDANTYGSDLYRTPNIDRLARQGVKFTNAYASGNVCSPTRGAIMTGMNPARTNLTDWINGKWELRSSSWKSRHRLMPPDWTQHLEKKYTTLAEALKEAGYHTAHIGKWHLTPSLRTEGVSRSEVQSYYPEHQGFNINVSGNQWGKPGRYYWPYTHTGGGKDPMMNRTANFQPPEKHRGEYMTRMHTDETVRLLQKWKDSEKPFFIQMWPYAVHTPMQGPKELVAEYQRIKRKLKNPTHTNTEYAAMIETMDASLGRIMGKLRELNMAEDTVLIFASDNGGHVVTENDPLREYKGSAYEGGVRIPMIVRWPGHTPPGAVSDEPVITHDLYPTILDMTGTSGNASHNRSIDGMSLTSLLENPEQPLDREALYWHYPHYHRANPYSAVRAGKWRLIHFYLDDRIELYNLEKDISESNDLSQKRPKLARKLKSKLDAWRERVDAQPPRKNPLYGSKIASYRFDDEDLTDDENEAYPLTKVVNGRDSLRIGSDNFLSLPGNDSSEERDYLEVDGPGPVPKWTVSLWFRTPNADQGPHQGLFSNNRSANGNWSWELVVHNGHLQLRSRNEENQNPVVGDRQVKSDRWYHVVVRKTGLDGDAELYLGTKNNLSEVGNIEQNPGGLQMFRIGVNRNTDHLYRTDISKITIYRDTIPVNKLHSAGPFGTDPK